MSKPSTELHVAVEEFVTSINGEQFHVKRGGLWRGEVVRLHPDYFCPVSELTHDRADDNEAVLARRRAALQI
jgi:hypothetical protein